MRTEQNKKIIRLLGVGFDTEDGHVRMTNGDQYDVLMGSEESHEYIQQLLQRIENAIKAEGKRLDEVSPDELRKLVAALK
jgi:hypothetical protein